VLIALWSPKGGSGTSVVAASLALVAAERFEARLADLGGDQPAILGLPPL
jgi:MinD superfamily P-loop ATPase